MYHRQLVYALNHKQMPCYIIADNIERVPWCRNKFCYLSLRCSLIMFNQKLTTGVWAFLMCSHRPGSCPITNSQKIGLLLAGVAILSKAAGYRAKTWTYCVKLFRKHQSFVCRRIVRSINDVSSTYHTLVSGRYIISKYTQVKRYVCRRSKRTFGKIQIIWRSKIYT